jgi:hypothetical protein
MLRWCELCCCKLCKQATRSPLGWGFAPGSHVTEQQPQSAASPSPPRVQRRAGTSSPYHPHHTAPLMPSVGGSGKRAHTAALHQRGTTRREVLSRVAARATTAPTGNSSLKKSQSQQRQAHSPFDTNLTQYDDAEEHTEGALQRCNSEPPSLSPSPLPSPLLPARPASASLPALRPLSQEPHDDRPFSSLPFAGAQLSQSMAAEEAELQAGWMVGSTVRFYGPFDHDGRSAGEGTVTHTMRRPMRAMWAPVLTHHDGRVPRAPLTWVPAVAVRCVSFLGPSQPSKAECMERVEEPRAMLWGAD